MKKMAEDKEDEESDPDEARRDEKQCVLNPEELEKTLRSNLWWMYMRMLLALHGVLIGFESWCRSSPCHWHLVPQDSDDETNFPSAYFFF